MTKTIAISGKGGTGKSTLSSMIIRNLIEMDCRPVLAVDADPNACLALMLGQEAGQTVADVREDALKKEQGKNPSMGRLETFELGCQQLLDEADGFDLLTMGRPEGPSCYCAANNVLRKFLEQLRNSYKYVVVDNEAGMEHLSRRTTNDIDLLVIVAEPTKIGFLAAKRIVELINSLPINVEKVGLIWNRIDRDFEGDLDGIEVLGSLPFDGAVEEMSIKGGTVFDLEQDSIAFSAVRNILKNIVNTL